MTDYSHKDFTGRDLSERKDMDGQTIVNSCFSQETPDRAIFPANMRGVTFINCNLDNCVIPAGNVVQGGLHRRYKVQNCLNDWEIDGDDRPVRLVNYKMLEKLGLPQPFPSDIPAQPAEKRVVFEDSARNVRANDT